ncbi:hypothetical protein BD560DRAFT_325749 [Blakeslea trispora]|nr:hypothetical protein BD560DRAFT_325749 [Blakeslea trispora]
MDCLLPNDKSKLLLSSTIKAHGFSVNFILNKRTTRSSFSDFKLEYFVLRKVGSM